MSSFKIDIKGVDVVKKALKQVPEQAAKVINEELDAFGLETVNDYKRNVPVDEGFLRNSATYVKGNLFTEVVIAANYASFIEFGTRRFAAQYVASLPAEWQEFAAQFKGATGGSFEEFLLRIMGWVKRHGLDSKAAYPIALKILREGIKAHPALVPTVQKNSIELLKNLKARLDA